jgi:TRAP-type C4-dicarboxylate transport system permease small subunit
MKASERAWTIFDKTLTALMVIGAALIIFDALAITFDILVRYFIGRTWNGLFEITEYSIVWMTFLATAWLLKTGGHVRMDVVLNHLSPRRRAITTIITSFICTILFGVITWYTLKLTVHDYLTGFGYQSVLSPPKWTIEFIIPIGSFLLFIQFLRITYGSLTSWKAQSTEGTNTIG